MTRDSARRILDHATVDAILAKDSIYLWVYEDGDAFLELVEFEDFEEGTLDRLADHLAPVNWASYDVRQLPMEIARKLSRIKTDALYLSTGYLSYEAACVLAVGADRENPPVLDIGVREPMSVQAISALVDFGSKSMLGLQLPTLSEEAAVMLAQSEIFDLSFRLPSISEAVAFELSRATAYRLYLRVPAQAFTPRIAMILAEFRGDELFIQAEEVGDSLLPIASRTVLSADPRRIVWWVPERNQMSVRRFAEPAHEFQVLWS